MYIVVSVEHTNSFDEYPNLLGKFDTKEEAERFKEEKIQESLKEFPKEVRDGDLLFTEDCNGSIDYGYLISIIEV